MQPFTISADNLSKRFRTDWIFRGFSHTFAAGNVYAITGPNGSGKSTLMQILWGQMLPTSGSVQYAKAGTAIDPNRIYLHTSLSAPYLELLDAFTLEEHVRFHFRLRKARNGFDIRKVIEMMGFHDERKKQISMFSSGMLQRLKLGLAFATDSDVLFLDEPFTNLDKSAQDWYRHHLDSVAPGCLVVIASHEADQYSDKALTINMLELK